MCYVPCTSNKNVGHDGAIIENLFSLHCAFFKPRNADIYAKDNIKLSLHACYFNYQLGLQKDGTVIKTLI